MGGAGTGRVRPWIVRSSSWGARLSAGTWRGSEELAAGPGALGSCFLQTRVQSCCGSAMSPALCQEGQPTSPVPP